MARPNEVAQTATLQAAQERLALLRQQRREERLALGLPVLTDDSGRVCLPKLRHEKKGEGVDVVHIGWESEPVTKVLRMAWERGQERREGDVVHLPRPEPQPTTVCPSADDLRTTSPAGEVTCFPDIALAMLRGNLVASGRVWFLLRWLDKAGRGWLDKSTIFQALADRKAALGICGQRQLGNLLKRADGLFWQWREGRVWLFSAVKVAAKMGLEQLGLRPVALPVQLLAQSIGKVRAFLYSTFHSARAEKGLGGPIARHKLKDLSQVSRRTQQAYEKRSGVKSCVNLVIGPKVTEENKQRLAAQHGLATFHFTDRHGRHGRPGETYIAWQLPNSYEGPLTPLSAYRLKKFNHRLADLWLKGTMGNSKKVDTLRPGKCFYDNGQKAVVGFNRSPEHDAYWPGPKSCGQYRTWYPLIGESC